MPQTTDDHTHGCPQSRKFKCISAVEMAEHVGLANFQLFLGNIKSMLEDDGLFYIQVSSRPVSRPAVARHSTIVALLHPA